MIWAEYTLNLGLLMINWDNWGLALNPDIVYFWGVFLAMQSSSPCGPRCCQSDLRRVPFSDWPAPSKSSRHQRTSQSAAEEAPQCPALTTPTSKQNTKCQFTIITKNIFLSYHADSFSCINWGLMISSAKCVCVLPNIIEVNWIVLLMVRALNNYIWKKLIKQRAFPKILPQLLRIIYRPGCGQILSGTNFFLKENCKNCSL